MKFIHEDSEFRVLLRIVEHETGIDAALIEKDYWITHCLWALQRTGLDIWFKGGTNLPPESFVRSTGCPKLN